jgi:hypothetical protein
MLHIPAVPISGLSYPVFPVNVAELAAALAADGRT